MKEARIEARVKNNVLYQAIRSLGMTAAEFCRRTDFTPTILYGLITLRASPFRKHGGFTEQSRRLANLVGIEPENLFPGWLYQLEKTAANIEFSFAELPPGFNPLLIPASTDIDQEVLLNEFSEKLPMFMSKLTDRQRKIICLRFGIGDNTPRNLLETSKASGLSSNQVKKIEQSALKKLRWELR